MTPATKGPLLFTGAMLFFSTMSALAKLAGETLPMIEVVFFRSAAGIPVLLVLALATGTPLRVKRKALLLGRCLAGITALVIFFYAIKFLPVANVLLLNQTNPIFVLPLAAVFLGERVTFKHVLLVFGAIAGAVFVIKPDAAILANPGLLALGSSFFTAIAYVLLRKLTATEQTLTIVFWFHLIGAVVVFPFMVPVFVQPDPKTLLMLIGMGLLATVGQLLMTRAYSYTEAGKLAVVGSMGAVFGAVFDLLIWHHLPDLWTGIGALMIIICCSAIQMIRGGRTLHVA
jgi:drug/metabolite transporter (DMT)-like permease